jgi:hypothetical protein
MKKNLFTADWYWVVCMEGVLRVYIARLEAIRLGFGTSENKRDSHLFLARDSARLLGMYDSYISSW